MLTRWVLYKQHLCHAVVTAQIPLPRTRLCLHACAQASLPLTGVAPDCHWTGPHLWAQGPCKQWVDSWHLPPLPSIQSKESSTKDLATTGAPSKPPGAAPSGGASSVWDATTHAISSHPTVGLWVIQLLLHFCGIHSALRAGWPV